MEEMVFSAFVTAWRLPGSPTSLSPVFVNATTEGAVKAGDIEHDSDIEIINPDFKANHIGDLGHAIGIAIPENLEINLTTLIELGILEKRDEIAERSIYATGQKKLNATLDKLKEKYKQMKFDLISFNESDVFILKDIEPLCEEIDTILTKIVSLSSSKFAKFLSM